MAQYRKLADELGIKDVYFTYILSSHFKDPYYEDVLNYIKSIPNCDYYFVEEDK